MSARRLIISVDVLKPDDRSVTQFWPHFMAKASIVAEGENAPVAEGVSADWNTAAYAVENAMNALALRCRDTAPNGPMCHHPTSCTLAGSCLKQRGGGTACNE